MWNQSAVDGPIPIRKAAGGYGSGGYGTGGFGVGFEVAVPGYHLNMVPSLVPPAAEPFRTHPRTPTRIYAGDAEPWTMTGFFRFESEWQARATMPELWLDRFEQLEDRLTYGATPQYGNDNEVQFRAEVLKRLDELQQALDAASGGAAGIGHNNPPDLDEPDDPIRGAQRAIPELKAELASTRPNVKEVTERARVLDRLGVALEAARREPSKLAHVGLEKWRESLVVAASAWAGSHWAEVQEAILGALQALHTWLMFLLS